MLLELNANIVCKPENAHLLMIVTGIISLIQFAEIQLALCSIIKPTHLVFSLFHFLSC